MDDDKRASARQARLCAAVAAVFLMLTVLAGVDMTRPGTSWWGPIVGGVAACMTVRYVIAAAVVRSMLALREALERIAEELGVEQ